MSIAAPRRRRSRGTGLAGRSFAGLVPAALLVLAVVAGGAWLAGLLPGLDGPFEEQHVDRSPPALLRSLAEIREYRAATGHFETIIDLERIMVEVYDPRFE